MNLYDIFIKKPELLDDPEVKLLIKHFQDTYKIVVERNRLLQETNFKMITEAMESEIMIINGKPSAKAIENIIRIYGE